MLIVHNLLHLLGRMDGNMSVNLEWLSSLDFPLAENLVVYDLEGFLNADVNKKGQY